MAIEPRRGCGYRKVGGLYLVGERLTASCCRFPIELSVCPTCHGGIKPARGWQWVDPATLLPPPQNSAQCGAPEGLALSPLYPCPLLSPTAFGARAGLLWVGTGFYATPADFLREAQELGVSKRIKSVPRGFTAGKHWVLIAHPKGMERPPKNFEEIAELAALNDERFLQHREPLERITRAAVICALKPYAIEKIVTKSQVCDGDAMAKLRAAGITPVEVPDDDADHRGSVYDKPE